MINPQRMRLKLLLIPALLVLHCGLVYGQGLVAWYPFDNSVADHSGNNNDGFIRGGVMPVPDRFGHPCAALQFNGRDGFIEVPSSLSLKTPIKNVSVTCWFRLDSNATVKNRWLTLLCKGMYSEEGYKNPQYRVQVYQSDIQSTVSVSTDFTEYDTNFVQNRFDYGRWYFFALVYNGSTISMYIDNNRIWEFTYRKTFNANDDPLHIGRDVPGNPEFFCGALDDLRIYNTALSDPEIAALYKEDNYVVIKDTLSISCPKDIVVSNDKGKCTAKVNFNKASISYACSGITLRQISGLPSGSNFPIGISTIGYEVKNESGITRKCTLTITVLDGEAPLFECPGDTVIINANRDGRGMIVNYRFPKVKDDCSTIRPYIVRGIPSGSEFPPGNTLLHFAADDAAGNHSECSFNVYIADPSEKIIRSPGSCPADIVANAEPGRCGAKVTYAFPNAADTRNYIMSEGIESGRYFPNGTTLLRFQKPLGNGMVRECSFRVTVREDEAPRVSCPNDTSLNCEPGVMSIAYDYAEPVATDNCGIDSLYRTRGPESGSLFSVGVNTIRYLAIDQSGNATECSFNVTVNAAGGIATTTPAATEAERREKTVSKSYMHDKVAYTPDMKFKRCEITMVLYDVGQEDNDTVSVFFNGEEIVKQEMIRLKDHRIIMRQVVLIDGERNDFVVKAWNIGSISPNTIKIEFYEGHWNEAMLKLKKPKRVRVLNSKPGIAGAISINCAPKP
jgi:hypothetical protein